MSEWTRDCIESHCGKIRRECGHTLCFFLLSKDRTVEDYSDSQDEYALRHLAQNMEMINERQRLKKKEGDGC